MTSAERGMVSCEDLGESVLQSLRLCKYDVSNEDMALLADVSNEDLSLIQEGMSNGRDAKEIWQELLGMLKERKERAVPIEHDLLTNEEQKGKAERECLQDGRKVLERAQEEDIVLSTGGEAATKASPIPLSSEGRSQSETMPKSPNTRAPGLQGEWEVAGDAKLPGERENSEKNDDGGMVEDHPLALGKDGWAPRDDTVEEIAQKVLPHTLNMPPRVSGGVLNRTYTPKCPNCGMRFGQPPPMWECPMCLKNEGARYLVWQPDSDSVFCMVCRASIGRWSRHHCRSCGRLVCSNCCSARAWIKGLGFSSPVKVCTECANHALSTKN
ncbi:unnamed protein product [Phytomonas sp. EM1]|nr:unnamed protein product [Phytomonas sp. EM1]|eukprot:CCW61382.1 unnamed protein product [Phytomonas sp. isolate EM1]